METSLQTETTLIELLLIVSVVAILMQRIQKLRDKLFTILMLAIPGVILSTFIYHTIALPSQKGVDSASGL